MRPTRGEQIRGVYLYKWKIVYMKESYSRDLEQRFLFDYCVYSEEGDNKECT